MLRKILSTRDARLRQISKPVQKIDKKIKVLIHDLKDTLAVQKDPEGVGLAAAQIGTNLRLFVMNDAGKIRAIINPEVIKTSEKVAPVAPELRAKRKKGEIMEGCLSLPYYYGPLKRIKEIKLEFLDEDGKKKQETFSGFSAQIVQHELDHLNGILFVDRLLEQKKPLYKLEGDEWEEVELV